MPVNMSGPLLRTSASNEYRPLGVMGQPVFMNHRKIKAAIGARLGSDFTSYLARPEIDEANRRIHWHAECEGPVRRWSDLDAAEQQAASPKIEAMRDDFLTFVNDLEAREKKSGSEESFAQLIRQSLRAPALDSLYMVGDQPVLTLWGFEGEGDPFDTLGFSAIGGAAPAVIPQATAGTVAVAATAGRPWWRWLLWWLLFILALLLLAWLLRSCGVLPEGVIPGQEPERPVEEQPVTDPPVDPERDGVIVRPDGTILRPDGTVVQPDGTVIGPDGSVVDPEAVETPSTEGDAPDTGTTDPATDEPVTPPVPEQPEQPGDEQPGTEPETPPQPDQPAPEPETSETPEADADQQQQDPPAPDQQPEPQPEDQPQDPNAPDPDAPDPNAQDPNAPDANNPDQGQPLEIPPADGQNGGNGGVGFMQGEWKSDGGLVDESSGKPLDQRYKFNENGEGEVVIRQGDGTVCRGGASASRTGDGGLRITENGPINCADGSAYAPSVTNCRPSPNGKTICTGTNPDGSTFSVEVTK
jgi:hypothetical protein